MRASVSLAPAFTITVSSATDVGTTLNGTCWQRLTIVGNIASAVRAIRMNITPGGGSSMVLSNAFAA